ncbi:hypothetical protein ARALYDRAFT_914041 [Arabidopsis lyrata subsp. lyrata]|uniref:FBD domain-containing protein n=2 Tax=Arabidopsis lyrata subsp. lyrata TaxID=81972 RepID=D7MG13_ARALL|nr:hypothetical protein ARALYDRAFT_914041 [Arabidopsis lyrata subsp. lyrata]
MEHDPRCHTDASFENLVAKAVDGRVHKLLWSADPTRLPKSLFTCETLVDLTLSHKILVDFPSSCCLPSLLLLCLHYVVYEDEASLVRFLSSCPGLEKLCVKRKKDDNMTKFCVKVPTLWLLAYDNSASLPDDNGGCLVIDTPALTNFYLTDYSGDSCSIENMPCFEDVSIDVDQPFPNIDKFFTSFSTVFSLELLLTDETIVCCSKINFSRLTKCKIVPFDSDWMDSLVPLLNNTPRLKSLVVDYRSTHQSPIASATWSERGYNPECLYSSLEKFELIDYGGREEEEELVEYILSTSRCLKTVTIYLKSTLEPEIKDTMMEKLEAMDRFSGACQLLFKTEYVNN